MRSFFVWVVLALAAAPLVSPAADRYWVGGSGNNWNNANNWATSSGGTPPASIPGASDNAIFDSNSPNCTCDAGPNVTQLKLLSGFNNVLDMAGYSLTINYAAGNGRFQIDSGEIKFGSGTHTIRGDWMVAGGTVTPNTSTVRFYPVLRYITAPPYDPPDSILEINGSCTLSNVTFIAESPSTGSFRLWITNGSLTVNGTLSMDGGDGSHGYLLYGGGEIKARGKIAKGTIGGTHAGNVRLTVDGAGGDQVQDGLMWAAGNYTVNKSIGTLIVTNTTVFGGGTRTYTFNSPVDFTSSCTRVEFWPYGGTTVTLAGSADLIFYDLDSRGDSATNPGYLELGGRTVTVLRNCLIVLDNGGGHARLINNGTLDIKGNLTLSVPNPWSNTRGTALVRMSGTSDSQLNGDGTSKYFNNLVIAKSGGAKVTLVDALGIQGGSLTNEAGSTLDLGGFGLGVGTTFSVGASTLRLKGNEPIAVGAISLDTNASTVVYYDAATNACLTNFPTRTFGNLTFGAGKTHTFGTGTVNQITVRGVLGSDGSRASRSILRSLSDGTPWYLNLAGSSDLQDKVDVKDSDASPGKRVEARGSRDSGYNVHWGLRGCTVIWLK